MMRVSYSRCYGESYDRRCVMILSALQGMLEPVGRLQVLQGVMI